MFVPSFNLSDLDGSNGFVLNGINIHDIVGQSVSGAGDINGDGIDDLIIGASLADPNGQYNAGESYVIFGGSAVGSSGSLALSALDGRNGFVLNGINERDSSGRAVSGAGDINGDGIDDLILGAYRADPNGNRYSGESYVVFGGSAVGNSSSLELSALDGSNGFVLKGINTDDRSGASVSDAGDINGDGIDDLIIGAPGGDPNENNGAGESYVVFGGSAVGNSGSLELSALDGSNGFSLNGINNYDGSGRVVSGAGDVNGDGFDDLIIGASGANPNGNNQAGETYVVFGGSAVGSSGSLDLATLEGSNGFSLNGTNPFDSSGRSISGAGDVNGDGFDDLIIGAPGANPNGNNRAGETYVIFGSSTVGSSGNLDLAALDGSNGFVLRGIAAFDALGQSVSGAGDINGDGMDDLIIGATIGDSIGESTGEGKSYAVFGSSDIGSGGSLDLTTLDGSNGFVLNGVNANDFSGYSVSGTGDINGDGVDDFIIGATNAGSGPIDDPGNDESRPGASYVVFGINQANDAPIAADDTFTTHEGVAATIDVLGNDTDVDNDSLSIDGVVQPTHGSVRLNEDNTLTYTPNSGFTGTDSFTYTVTDGNEGTDTATVLIEVLAVIEPAPVLFDYEQFLRSQQPIATVPIETMDGLPLAQLFDEQYYLNQNSDVAAAVSTGGLSSGYQHFVQFGLAEGRNPSVLYDEAFYLANNADIAAAVAADFIDSGLTHFLLFGHEEARDPSSLFNSEDYLTNNPDVVAAVEDGLLQSAFEHYIVFGADENRLPALSLYNEAFYLENNPDAEAAIAEGTVADGLAHFIRIGQQAGLAPSTLYNEASYRSLHPDVDAAVATGLFASGFEHYATFGRFEGRTVS
ncbi:MAG: FG-GAP repeat protein [Leptolyngbya sp. SIO1E4]|nr:FG-GAP repeat protein [Leptolyngbya sp. SIO1E4]